MVFASLLLVTALGGYALAATGRERHEAIYPPQKIPLAFNHAQHIEQGAECVACHDSARKSVKASDVLLPKAIVKPGEKIPEHPECENCHDIAAAAEGKPVDPPAACTTCHLNAEGRKEVAKTSFPTANLIFNHKVHVELKYECTTCHFSSASGTMDDVGLATRYQLPKMETCLACHNGQKAPADCKTCHLTDPSGRLQLTFASATLRPSQGDPFGLDHGPKFELTHGTRAKLDRGKCTECHTESSCMTCHDSLQKPLSVHPNDFITIHPVSARLDALNCEGCHRYQSFCAACHERAGIGKDSDPSLRARNLRVHSTNFVNNQASPEFHAVAAARDIKQCISCHREESCMACHATREKIGGSRSANPHPDGFAARCKQLAGLNDRACLKCHTEGDLVNRSCR